MKQYILHETIAWTNDNSLSIKAQGINFSEKRIRLWIFPLTKIYLKMSSVKQQLLCFDINV